MRRSLLAGILLAGALISCDSDSDPAPQLKTSEINLRYDTYSNVKEYELILSEDDGTVLLDTLLASRAEHTLRIESVDTRFNVTTIILNPSNNKYSLKTYIQVSPDNWHLRDSPTSYVWGDNERSKLTYINLPNPGSGFHFMTMEPGGWRTGWSGSTMTIDYDRLLPEDIAYLLLPRYKKYLMSNITSTETTLDFSRASNAALRKFEKPEGITDLRTYLLGYPKAGSYSKMLRLYTPLIEPSTEYDLQYPTTGIAEFDLRMQYYDADGNWHTYQHVGTSIPATMNFEPKADFTVEKSGFDDFQLTFEHTKANAYYIIWASEDADFIADWKMFIPTDKPGFAPRALLENLNSKLIAGKDLSHMQLSNVISLKYGDYNYQEAMDHLADPAAIDNKVLKSYRSISMIF